MKLFNGSIGTRLRLGFGIIILLLIITAGVGYWGVSTVTDKTVKTLHAEAEIMEHASRARANVLGMRRFEKDMILNFDSPEKVKGYYENFQKEKERLVARIGDLGKVATLPEDKTLVAEMEKSLATYVASIGNLNTGLAEKKITTPKEGDALVAKEAIRDLEKDAKAYADEGSKRLAAVEPAVRQDAKATLLFLLILSGISIGIGIAYSFFLARSITRQLRGVTDGLNAASDQVASASAQIAASSQHLAEGSSEQASSLEETSSSLEEMASMTKQNAKQRQPGQGE